MHEDATLRDLRAKVAEVAAAHSADRVAEIAVWLGALSHFSEATFRSGWARVAAGTPGDGARLSVEASEDLTDPRAQGVVLLRVVVSTPEASRATERLRSRPPAEDRPASTSAGGPPCA